MHVHTYTYMQCHTYIHAHSLFTCKHYRYYIGPYTYKIYISLYIAHTYVQVRMHTLLSSAAMN